MDYRGARWPRCIKRNGQTAGVALTGDRKHWPWTGTTVLVHGKHAAFCEMKTGEIGAQHNICQ